MSVAPYLPTPTAIWAEPALAGAALPLARLYWQYASATGTWSLTSDRTLESGRLVDTIGSGDYILLPLASIPPGAAVLQAAILNGTITWIY